MIIDSHCHLNYSNDDISLEEIINNARDSNIKLMLNIATKQNEFENIINISALYHEVYFTLGIHPHEANHLNNDVIKEIYMNENNKKFIGIGETGLDYFYNNSDKSSQISSFEKQIEIAQNLSIPLVIHMRSAEEDTLKIIRKKIKEKTFNGVIHCFTGTKKFADEIIELGFYISASGIITFKKSFDLRNIFAAIPDDKILAETDSPYLSPEPLRGKMNQPAHIVHTIKKLAEIRNTNYDKLIELTKNNFLNLFQKIDNY
jgi:TatD DNase family protein|tara:strand:+ start:1201 stop:1980 length:780 start_codon:yes stop_codon:yes gene_type:complete